jgi:hypothetical protein
MIAVNATEPAKRREIVWGAEEQRLRRTLAAAVEADDK